MRIDGLQIDGSFGNVGAFKKITSNNQLSSFKETIGTFLNDVMILRRSRAMHKRNLSVVK